MKSIRIPAYATSRAALIVACVGAAVLCTPALAQSRVAKPSSMSRVALNPQPLPPRLNPQPLPPKLTASPSATATATSSTQQRGIIIVSGRSLGR